jgi:hypothetical protein
METIFGCQVTSIKYDFEKGVGHVYMPIGNCTDMKGTVEFFLKISPICHHIITWQQSPVQGVYDIDTQYIKPEQQWLAI